MQQAHRILSIRSHVEDEPEISIYQVRGHDVAPPYLALPRPVLCLNMGLLKRHMEFMRAQGLRRCCALSGHSQSEWQTENDKEATAANKEKCRQWSRVSGREGGGVKRRQGCLESFANLFKSGPLLNCCCLSLFCCCCHLAACNSFAC